MRALVTGGAGFIGSHLVRRLLAEGLDVGVLDNFATGRRENLIGLERDIELIEGDIQGYEWVRRAVNACDCVFHLAALTSVPRSVEDPVTSNGANVIGTLNVLLAARDADVGRVVFASSSSVYGPGTVMPMHEGLAPSPVSPYAVSKLAGEGYCRSFHEVYGVSAVAVRYFNVFGPRQDPESEYSAVIPRFILAGLNRETPVIYGDGERSRDFTFVEDAVEGAVLAMRAPGVAGRVFNIACGECASLNQTVSELESIFAAEIIPEYRPARPGDMRHTLADISLARAELGYQPRVSFADGLRRTVSHYAELDPRPSARVSALSGGAVGAQPRTSRL